MAIAATHLTDGFSVSTASSYVSASITPAANRLVLIAVGHGDEDGVSPAPTLSGAGMTWVQVDTAEVVSDGGDAMRVTVFRGMSASPGSGAITISFSDTQTGCAWGITEFAGVDTSGTDGSGAIVQSVPQSDTTPDASETITLAAFGSADNAAFGAIVVSDVIGPAITPGSGFTALFERGIDNSFPEEDFTVQSEWKPNDSTVDWSWTPSEHSAAVAVEIKAAVAAPVGGGRDLVARGIGRGVNRGAR